MPNRRRLRQMAKTPLTIKMLAALREETVTRTRQGIREAQYSGTPVVRGKRATWPGLARPADCSTIVGRGAACVSLPATSGSSRARSSTWGRYARAVFLAVPHFVSLGGRCAWGEPGDRAAVHIRPTRSRFAGGERGAAGHKTGHRKAVCGLTRNRGSRYHHEMGEIAALLSAFTWAGSSAMIGSQLQRVPTVVASAVRLIGGMLLLWAMSLVLLLVGQTHGLNFGPLLALAGSAVLGLSAGDTLYIAGIRHIGLARATPISMAMFPLFTFVLAAVLLGEAITPSVVGGAVLIVLGLHLVTRRPGSVASTQEGGQLWWGVGLVLLAALLWALAGVWLRAASTGVNPALAGAVRVSAAGLVTLAAMRVSGHSVRLTQCDRRSLLVLTAAGMFGTGLGSMLYVMGVQLAGAARAAILSSTTPLFALPLAALFLHERLTARLIGGALVSVVGIWLVTL